MNCDTARHLWHSDCDGEIAPQERASLHLHLQSCEACKLYAAQMAAITGALDDLRISTEAIGVRTASRRRWLPAWGSVAAAVAIMLGIGALLRTEHDGRREPATPTPSHVQNEPLRIALTGNSEEAYIPVVQETERADVHLIVLYRASN